MKFQKSWRRRTGTVTLLLALVTMIAVMTTVALVTRNEMVSRRIQMDARATSHLESAIHAIASSDLESSLPVRLPMDSSLNHWIEIQWTDTTAETVKDTTEQSTEVMAFTATELRDERALRSIERRIYKAIK
jgi:hypothetical protein